MDSLADTLVLPMPAAHVPSWLGNRKQAFLALLLLFAFQWVGAQQQNPLNDFCRRYGHQTTVIDDKLYIDGGFVNYNTYKVDKLDFPNKWLGFHDLNNLSTGIQAGWPQLNISLTKDDNIPIVHGGVLWGDSVNKRFFVFGGEYTRGLAQEFHVFSYDILYDKWDDLGRPKSTVQPTIASYGAGVGVSETGQGYYYGGWISNASMQGWDKERTMSSEFYRYEYDTNQFTTVNPPTDKLPRAEGAMVWIPGGDTGLLAYFGGVVSPYKNGTQAPQPLDEILVYDPATNVWFNQTARGVVPQHRRQFCADAAWAPDRSSYNIVPLLNKQSYLWGGLSVPPPAVNVTAFNDVYILSLPSFTWVKVFPDRHGNATSDYGHYAASCNMVKSNSQMLVIGGSYPGSDMCDLAAVLWAQHNLWTGTLNNDGDNKTYWASYNPNVTSNVVPVDVYDVVGGDKDGAATLLSPKSGYDSGNGLLQTLLERKPTFQARIPNRPISTSTISSLLSSIPTSSSPTSTPPPGPTHTTPPTAPVPKLSTGAIVGIVIGAVAGLGLLMLALFFINRWVQHRRQDAQQQEMAQASNEYGAAEMSPHLSPDSRKVVPVSPRYIGPPAELDT